MAEAMAFPAAYSPGIGWPSTSWTCPFPSVRGPPLVPSTPEYTCTA